MMGLISSNGFSCDASSNYSAFTFGPQFRDPVTMALIDTSSASGPRRRCMDGQDKVWKRSFGTVMHEEGNATPIGGSRR